MLFVRFVFTFILSHPFNHLAWITCGNTICGNILYNNTASTNDNIISDSDSRHHLNTCTNPDIISHRNRISKFKALISTFCINWMSCSIKTTIRRNKDIVSKSYWSTVDNDSIMICKEVFSDAYIVTIVAPKRRDNRKFSFCFP